MNTYNICWLKIIGSVGDGGGGNSTNYNSV